MKLTVYNNLSVSGETKNVEVKNGDHRSIEKV